MKRKLLAAALAATATLSGCKIAVTVPDEGGAVTTVSGNHNCNPGQTCTINVTTTNFDETFQAIASEGYAFTGWKKRDRGLCGGSEADCRLPTTGFPGNAGLMSILNSDQEFYLEPVFAPFSNAGITALLETNANIALAAYTDSVETAKDLKQAIDNFAQNPTQANLDAAKIAWLVAREPYGQTEVYRFRLSPIDSTDYTEENGPEGIINAWPLGEALIDYVSFADPDFGVDQVGVTANEVGLGTGSGTISGNESPAVNIISNTAIEITKDLLDHSATAEDERDVIAGYHAIEFLLWGQDLNNNAMVTDGANRDQAVKTNNAPNLAAGGQRPLTDFTTAPFADRRLAYLQVAAEKLVEDLESVRDGWLDNVEGNYRDKFTNFTSRSEAVQRITEILTGMGTLSEGELAGERMQIAYSSNSQEDEHSCFSDNTHRDVVLNAQGVYNSFLGEYAGYDSDLDGTVDATANAVEGYGFDDYAAELNIEGLTAISNELGSRLQTTANKASDIDQEARNGRPFDVLIMDANRSSDNPVYKTIIALNQQSASIAALAEKLAIEVKVVDDDASECDTSDPDATCG